MPVYLGVRNSLHTKALAIAMHKYLVLLTLLASATAGMASLASHRGGCELG